MSFLSVIWDFDPVLFSIGSFDVRWYGLMWSLGFAVSFWLFIDFTRREGYGPKVLDSIFWHAIIATIVGARLGHLLFYDAGEFLANPLVFFRFRDGGLASHGAAFGLLAGLWMFSRKNRMPYLWSLDRIMIAVAIAGAIVRIGNLFNSEIYGHPTDLPWGFIFVRDGKSVPMHPTQIYEALCYLATFGVLMFLYYKGDLARKRPGLLFGVGLIGVFLTRFLIEFIKNTQKDFEIGMALDMGQWLSIPFIAIGLWFLVRALLRPALEVKPIEKPAKR